MHAQSAITGMEYILNIYTSELGLHNKYIHNSKCGDDFTVEYIYTRIHLNIQFKHMQFIMYQLFLNKNFIYLYIIYIIYNT